jgi:aquaporin Z
MRRYAAEAIGTFGVVFMGCGAALVGGARIGDAGVALAFGLALAVMMIALGPVSGGHCNPAVTVASAIAGRLPMREVAPYVAAQLGGGVAGAALVVSMANGRPGGTPLAAQSIANGFDRLSPGFYGLGAALIAEIALTALFVLVVLGAGGAASSLRRRLSGNDEQPLSAAAKGSALGGAPAVAPLAALAAGASYALIHLVGIPVTRMGANPARSLGPALLAGGSALEQVAVFLAAPLAGALLAALAHRAIFGSDPARAASRAPKQPDAREPEANARG